MKALTQINKNFALLLLFALFPSIHLFAQNKSEKIFTIVLDAGHGGHDGGAQSVLRDENGNKFQEKNVALDVTLRVGKLLKDKYKNDIKIIYTREDDTFVELHQRAKIANNAKADLFIAIHCNSGSSTALGTETWILGSDSNRQNTNFDVIKAENSVILLEDDYEKKYDGFDPNSPEDVIALTLMQSTFYDSSNKFAHFIEEEFKQNDRFSRGVKQGGWLVLVRTAMPAVLVEMGFLSSTQDASVITTEEGKQKTAQAIVDAIAKYKKVWDAKHKSAEKTSESKKENKSDKLPDNKYYSIQFLTSSIYYEAKSQQMRGLKEVTTIKEGDLYRYYFGKTTLLSEKDKMLDIAKKAGFVEAKALEFAKNEKLTLGFYSIEILQSTQKYAVDDEVFEKVETEVQRIKKDKMFYYYSGKFATIEEAEKARNTLVKAGFQNAIITKFDKDFSKGIMNWF